MSTARKVCRVCGHPFMGTVVNGVVPAELCGQLLCVAKGTWTAEQWAGRKRMAEALVAAETECVPVSRETLRYERRPVVLSPLDREALRR